jgi:methylglutaconyl-CoA hydratase
MNFVQLTEEKSIAFVSLSRPEVRNAFNPKMITEIRDTFIHLSHRQDLRAIVFRGEGKVFCAGGDLGWMKDMINYSPEENKQDANQLFEMFESIYNCHVPVIGIVHGAAFGGALGLVACCDYVISEEKTQFCFSEVKLGLAPAVISAFVLKKCSMGHIGHLMLTGQVFTATEAKFSGLVHEICDEEALPDRLEVALGWMHQVGPEAVRATKSLVHRIPELSWEDAKDEAAETISERRVSAEGQEGLRSFLEKRKCSWSHS